ncbi:leucyl aminopeptidase [bacterium C-53]|nr:leucyl aminopeptidase [Lachnospiraceae bacterium]NBI04395.1 leucyl aminopeptidase [Lachnospiraceae bacterium]RKJ08290.1 leucyl aminopeptidase [bacterium C-53]
MTERFLLSMERIKEIKSDQTIEGPFMKYFVQVASFIEKMDELTANVRDDIYGEWDFDICLSYNHMLYEDILPEKYEESFANPEYAVRVLGNEYGQLLSFLYEQVRGMIPFAHEGRTEDITILAEVFLQVYHVFETEARDGMTPEPERIRQILYWFVSDYCDVTVERRILEQIDPAYDFAAKIIMESDLSDLRYLFRFGEYISENEIRVAQHLMSMEESRIQAMADTFTEGYRIGFINTGKDLSKKKVANLKYRLGFERIVRAAVYNFEKMGLSPTIYRAAVHAAVKGSARAGYYGAVANKQYEYDHKEDEAIFLDKAFLGRKLEVMRVTYENHKNQASLFAGPAVMEVFGEMPFVPVKKESSLHLTKQQQKLSVELASEAGMLVNEYIRGEERSFTIIAYPVPEIGKDFAAIFDETVKINTLDYKKYQEMQQAVIDVLDRGRYVEISGKGANRTKLTVALCEISNPESETRFENCVADVNIPVGEVFTSPRLCGTTGTLFVSEVYLNDLRYENLEFQFMDGFVTDYTCTNFEKEEENRKYVKDHILFHHETLPMGEFAIGTNTTAYAMAKKYNIFSRLPILIAEKTGPHFALGDTCYSHAEDVKVYNPNGKEIIARDNEVSRKRKEQPKEAYYNCHTDVTIPYDELYEISVITESGERIPIISDGKFVVKQCLELNEPLENTH